MMPISKKKTPLRTYQKNEWKYIHGFTGLAFVTIDGRLWYDEFMGRPVRQIPTKINSRYLKAGIQRRGIRRRLKVHRILALAFIPNPKNKKEVNHKDGNKLNNKLSNLEWATRAENAKHAGENGLMKKMRGELCGTSKLKPSNIPIIRNSRLAPKELAKKYRVSRATISNIVNKKSWAHIL